MVTAVTILRWIAVFPGAIAAWLLAGFATDLIALLMQFEGLGPIRFLVSPQMLDAILRDVIVPGATVWYGSRIAPTNRLQVAGLLLVIYVLFVGWAIGAVGQPLGLGQVAAGLMDVVLSITSAICGLYLVYRRERENSLPVIFAPTA